MKKEKLILEKLQSAVNAWKIPDVLNVVQQQPIITDEGELKSRLIEEKNAETDEKNGKITLN